MIPTGPQSLWKGRENNQDIKGTGTDAKETEDDEGKDKGESDEEEEEEKVVYGQFDDDDDDDDTDDNDDDDAGRGETTDENTKKNKTSTAAAARGDKGRGGAPLYAQHGQTMWTAADEAGVVTMFPQGMGMSPLASNMNSFPSPLADPFVCFQQDFESEVQRTQVYIPSLKKAVGEVKNGYNFLEIAAHAVRHGDIIIHDWCAQLKTATSWVRQLEHTFTWGDKPFVGRCELGAEIRRHEGRFTLELSDQADTDVINDLLSIAKNNMFNAYVRDDELAVMRMLAGALEGAAMAAVKMGQTTTGKATYEDLQSALNELPILLAVVRSWAKTFTNGSRVETNPYLFCPITGLGMGRPIMIPGAVSDYFYRVLHKSVGGGNNWAKVDKIFIKHLGQNRYRTYTKGRDDLDKSLRQSRDKLIRPAEMISIDAYYRGKPEDTRFCPHCFRPFYVGNSNRKLHEQVTYHPCTQRPPIDFSGLISSSNPAFKKFRKERKNKLTATQAALVHAIVNDRVPRLILQAVGGSGKSFAIAEAVYDMICKRGYYSVLHISLTHAAKLQCVTGETAHSRFKWDHVSGSYQLSIYWEKSTDLETSVTAFISDHFSENQDKGPFLGCELIVLGECYQYDYFTVRWIECFIRQITGAKDKLWGGRQVVLEGDAPQNDLFMDSTQMNTLRSDRHIPNPCQFVFQDPRFYMMRFEYFALGTGEKNRRYDDDIAMLVADIQLGNVNKWEQNTRLVHRLGSGVPNILKWESDIMAAGAYLIAREDYDAERLKKWLLKPHKINKPSGDEHYRYKVKLAIDRAVDHLLDGNFLNQELPPSNNNDDMKYHAHIGTRNAEKQSLALLNEVRWERRQQKLFATLLVTNTPDVTYEWDFRGNSNQVEEADVNTLMNSKDYIEKYRKSTFRKISLAMKIYKGMQVLLTKATAGEALHLYQRMTVEDYDPGTDELIVTVHHGPNFVDQPNRRLKKTDVETFSFAFAQRKGKKPRIVWTTVNVFPVIPAMFYTAKSTTGLTLPGWVLCCNVETMSNGDGYLMLTRATEGSKVCFSYTTFRTKTEWINSFKVSFAAVNYVKELEELQKKQMDERGGHFYPRLLLETFYLDNKGHVVRPQPVSRTSSKSKNRKRRHHER